MTGWKRLIVQPGWANRGDAILLASRIAIGAFLIWGVWDNIVSPARMSDFRNFLAFHGFPMPDIAAPLSVWAQFVCGIAFIAGFAIRWAGLFCAFNFAVAIAMVDAKLGVRGAFPATCLILFGLIFATIGAGRYSADATLTGNP